MWACVNVGKRGHPSLTLSIAIGVTLQRMFIKRKVTPSLSLYDNFPLVVGYRTKDSRQIWQRAQVGIKLQTSYLTQV